MILLAFRLFFRDIILWVFFERENDDRVYDCVLYSNINYSNKGQIKRAIYLFSQTKTCWDFQLAQMSVSQQASVAQWILLLPSHVLLHYSAERSMKRHLLIPWRLACYHAFFRPFPQIMQFNAIKLKIGVNSVGNGSGLALSEWPFLRSLPLVWRAEITLVLLNVNNQEAPCCLFCNNKGGCCLSVGMGSTLVQNRGAQSEVCLKDGEISAPVPTKQPCSVWKREQRSSPVHMPSES